MKNIGTVFLHTDAQIPDERFLVLINDMLASGTHCKLLSHFLLLPHVPVSSSHFFGVYMCVCVCVGDIPDLFSEEEVDMIVTSIRVELKALGLLDTRENCWNFFIDRIRRQLKVGFLI